MDDLVKNILIMAALLALSAYFSATETAFNSMNRTRVRAMAEKGDKDAELALKLSENYDRLLSTILVGNNIVNIALAAIGTMIFVNIYGASGAAISTGGRDSAGCSYLARYRQRASQRTVPRSSP